VSLLIFVRAAGVSLIVLALFHVVLWRTLGWGKEIERLSPLNARVFAVHTFFIAFVLCALGFLSLFKPHLLLTQSELARLLLVGIVVFWVARLVIQPLVFDRVMVSGFTRSPVFRVGAGLVWAAYVAIYGAALAGQLGTGAP
jgi:hypothetical protein